MYLSTHVRLLSFYIFLQNIFLGTYYPKNIFNLNIDHDPFRSQIWHMLLILQTEKVV